MKTHKCMFVIKMAIVSFCPVLLVSSTATAQEAASAPATAEAITEVATVQPQKAKNAEANLKEKMKGHKWLEGWDSKKKRVFSVATAEFKSADPAHDKKFYILREAAMKRATLLAKANIIEIINTEMSAEDRLDVPGTDVAKALGAERDAIRATIIAQRDRLATLLERIDSAEAKTLREASFGERLKDLMTAATKKLDASFDSGARQEAAIKEYETAKQAYEEAVARHDELLEKANAMQPTSTQSSAIETLAKMPIYGATTILQTESWDSKAGVYQVAVLATWSAALERAARSVATSKPIIAEPGAKSVQEWIDDQDLALMVGARQYVDNEGNRWFLGISAREYSDDMSVPQRSQSRQLTEMFAKQMALFSVYADVESWKAAQQMMEEFQDGAQAMESVANKISQVVQKRTVRGMMKLGGGEFTHPITQANIYISVFGLNATMAKDCIDIEAANIAAKIEDNIHQSQEKGRKLANEAAVKASVDRPGDIAAGAASQKAAIDAKSRENAQRSTRVLEQPAAETPASAKKSTGGVFGGDVDVSDDF